MVIVDLYDMFANSLLLIIDHEIKAHLSLASIYASFQELNQPLVS